MPNIAAVLKAEVARLSRKEVRAETEGLKKATSTQRSEVQALKQRVAKLEKLVRELTRATATVRKAQTSAQPEADGSEFRFSAKGLASNRQRLGLSAADFGLLVGTTGQSVYAWESGKSGPRPASLAAIAALRNIGKREVTKRLEKLKAD